MVNGGWAQSKLTPDRPFAIWKIFSCRSVWCYDGRHAPGAAERNLFSRILNRQVFDSPAVPFLIRPWERNIDYLKKNSACFLKCLIKELTFKLCEGRRERAGLIRRSWSLVIVPQSIAGTKGTGKRMENETKRVGISQSCSITYNGESCAHSISISSIP